MSSPGKSYRKGLTLLQVAEKFGNEEESKNWIKQQRWPDGVRCPHCKTDNVQENITHATMEYRCRECEGKPKFSLRTGTIMEGTKLKYRVWAIGIYLFTTNIKGVSSMKLHRELGITQKSAWFLLHRLRAVFEAQQNPFEGTVEVDETYIGGKRRNMPNSKRKELTGRGAVGKVAVVGMKNRETNQIVAQVVQTTDKETLQGFVEGNTTEETTVYTDEAKAYEGMSRTHKSVKHSVSQYVNGQAHTNGIESFWALMKKGYNGTYHKFSPKHTHRYITEFAGRFNHRPTDTLDQMAEIVKGMSDKRIRYRNLIADNGLASGARVG